MKEFTSIHTASKTLARSPPHFSPRQYFSPCRLFLYIVYTLFIIVLNYIDTRFDVPFDPLSAHTYRRFFLPNMGFFRKFPIDLNISDRRRHANAVFSTLWTPCEYRKMLSALPAELALHTISFIPLTCIPLLRLVHSEWKIFVDTHKNSIYRSAAILHLLVPDNASLEDVKRGQFLPWLDVVVDWETLCKLSRSKIWTLRLI